MQRRTRWIVGIAAVVGLVLVGANVTGAAPLPFGPMGERRGAVPDGAITTMAYDVNMPPYYTTVQVENTWPVPVTVLDVRPVGATMPASIEILGSLRMNSDDPAQRSPDGMSQVILGWVTESGPGWTEPDPVAGVTVEPKGAAQEQGRSFLVRITPDPTRATSVLRFEVDYALGPLRFTTTAWSAIGSTITFCGPDHPTADQGCGVD